MVYCPCRSTKGKGGGYVFIGSEKTGQRVRPRPPVRAASTACLEGFPVSMWDGAGAKEHAGLTSASPRDAGGGRADRSCRRCCPANWRPTASCSFELVRGPAPAADRPFTTTPARSKRMRQFFAGGHGWRCARPGFRRSTTASQCGKAFEGAPEIALVNGMAMPVHSHCRAGLAQADGGGQGARSRDSCGRRAPRPCATAPSSRASSAPSSARSSAPSPG